jgi:hypothetical protein
MSVQFDSSRSRWVVRWSDGGRQRCRRFADEQAARAFDAERAQEQTARREAAALALADDVKQLRRRLDDVERPLPVDAQSSGISPYATRDGVCWRVAVSRPDGTTTTRRGFTTHAAARVARDRLARTDPPGRDTSFGRLWRDWLNAKQPYLTQGAFEDLEAHGRKRLLPHLAQLPIGALSERHIRDWLTAMTEHRQAGTLSTKTINNARAALSSALADAARKDLLPHNPCRFVAPLPADRRELDYLRLHEIGPYLDACTAHYRPLAELLIGTGVRISEALALTWNDIDLDRARSYPPPTLPAGKGFASDEGQASAQRAHRPSTHRHAHDTATTNCQPDRLAVQLPTPKSRPLRQPPYHRAAPPQDRPRLA